MVSEKDLQSYLKVAASALPCREARKEFSSYVHNVAHDTYFIYKLQLSHFPCTLILRNFKGEIL